MYNKKQLWSACMKLKLETKGFVKDIESKEHLGVRHR